MRILLTVLLSAGALFGQAPAGPAQGPPPKNLTKQPDGHISANPDPADTGKFEIHVVQPGETLSQIAESVLKDSRLWPQLWEQNEHIVNPHWIYPNDKILIRPVTKITEAVPPPAVVPAPVPAAPAAPRASTFVIDPPPAAPSAQRGASVIRPNLIVPPVVVTKAQDVFDLPTSRAVSEIKSSDMYCSGFVRATPVSKTLKVASTYERGGALLSTAGDYIRINNGSKGGVVVGSIYKVVRPTRRVDDATQKGTSKNLGMHYLDIGQIQIVQAQAETALARVTMNCEAIEVGDLMTPFLRVDVPVLPYPRSFSSTMTTSGQIKGTVILLKQGVMGPGPASGSLMSQGGVVYVNLGKGDGLWAGDLFIVYRGKAAIGEIAILNVDEWASSALVTYSTDALAPGDHVERR